MLSWIKSTSSSIKTLLIPCNAAQEAWTLLEKRLSPISKNHVRNLRDQIRTLKKTSQQSVSDYLIHAKSIFDLLAAGSNMSKAELVENALYGLQHEYKEFTTSLHLRQSLTFDEFFNLLQEKQLQKRSRHFHCQPKLNLLQIE